MARVTSKYFRTLASGVLVFIALVTLAAILGTNSILGFCSGLIGAVLVMWRILSPPKATVTWTDCCAPSDAILVTDGKNDYDSSLLKELDDSVTDAGYIGIYEEHYGL